METYSLWNGSYPGAQTEEPSITYYPAVSLPRASLQESRAAVLIFPGGGYTSRASHEGVGYAQLINTFGLSAFVVNYRVSPATFPDELLDARRAVRFVRANAEKFRIDKDKIAVMGSSAGGHLAALLCTYRKDLPGEGADDTDAEDYRPNLQILCYPVISSDETIGPSYSYRRLLGDDRYAERNAYSPDLLADQQTPPAFIWHTAADEGVNVINSYRMATRLRELSIPCEMHIFPYGPHGLGLAPKDAHVAQWTGLLRRFLHLFGYLA